MSWSDFADVDIDVSAGTVHVRTAGSEPAVLLLHGFPETSSMWRDIAPQLSAHFTVVCADLPGYGRSRPPRPDSEPAAQSKRAMSSTLTAVMERLGHRRFTVVGHDRGGRVAYRTALDHPDRVQALLALDVVPIDAAWQAADARLALGFWPWSLLAQDAPLPERLILSAPDAIIDQALSPGWGTPAEVFPAELRAEYLRQLQDPDLVHAICNEYRAAATVDREHDQHDLQTGRAITCPTLVLWSTAGPLGTWYRDEGGPLELWQPLAPAVTGRGVDGGHFFPEEHPDLVAHEIRTLHASTR